MKPTAKYNFEEEKDYLNQDRNQEDKNAKRIPRLQENEVYDQNCINYFLNGVLLILNSTSFQS